MSDNRKIGMITGFVDRNGIQIKIGDKTRLVMDNGEVREFDVKWRTVQRIVKCHPDFDDEYAEVYIQGVVFCWNGYELFPCAHKGCISDADRMEVIR